jgi:hypothetical protein
VKLGVIDWTMPFTLMLPELRRTTLPFVGSQCFLRRNADSDGISLRQVHLYRNWINYSRSSHHEKKTRLVTGHLTG